MTDTLPLLDVLTGALREAEQALATEGVEIIPVVLNDALDHGAPDRLIVDALVRHSNGVVLDASAGIPKAVTGPNEGLSAAVRASLRIRTDGGLQPLDVAVVDDELRVGPPDALVGQHSESGISELVGLATALFDRRIVGRQMAVLLYREGPLDPIAIEAAWSFVTTQLAGIELETLRALIVIVQAPRIVSARHCAPGKTLRFGVRDGDAVVRHSWHSDQAKTRAIAQSEGLVAFFLGAGFSASSRLPLGDELRNEALASMFGEDTFERLAERFHQHLQSNGQLADGEGDRAEFIRRLTLERVLEEQMRLAPGASPALDHFREVAEQVLTREPSASVASLREIVRRGRKIILVTVNFDRLIESDGGVEVFVTREQFGQFPDYLDAYLKGDTTKPPLLKLHGTIEERESIVATVGQVARGLMPERREALLAIARAKPGWIYIGYSMRDPDVTAVLGSDEYQDRVFEQWVAPLPAPAAREFAATRRQSRPDFMDRSITQSSDGFLTLLAGSW